jgi:hypothetical protein
MRRTVTMIEFEVRKLTEVSQRVESSHMIALCFLCLISITSACHQFGPNIFPQDRELNRGWSTEGKRYRALEREIAATPGTFFFCCLLYGDDSDFPAAVELGLLRPGGLYVERFRNRFD